MPLPSYAASITPLRRFHIAAAVTPLWLSPPFHYAAAMPPLALMMLPLRFSPISPRHMGVRAVAMRHDLLRHYYAAIFARAQMRNVCGQRLSSRRRRLLIDAIFDDVSLIDDAFIFSRLRLFLLISTQRVRGKIR